MPNLGKLLPASFRGVPFAVVEQSTSGGRNVAIHEYPGRDEVWVEDMGRKVTRYRVRGFILEDDRVYGGGSIEEQRALISAAAKATGPGVLVHPTWGFLVVSCEGYGVAEGIDGATFSAIDFSFLEAGAQVFPGLSLDSITGSGEVITAIAVVAAAVRSNGLSGQAAAGNANGTLPAVTEQWSAQVVAQSADATALSRLVATLPGEFGRFARGASGTPSVSTVEELVALAAQRRAAVAAAAGDLSAVGAAQTVSATEADFYDAVAGLVAALSGACADPADGVRLLTELLAFAPIGVEAAAGPGLAVTSAFLQAIALELVRVSTAYRPASYDDAAALLARVTAAIDDALSRASDARADDVFAALRSLRVAVVQDLRSRGANLAHVRTYTSSAPLPSVVLAQRLYRDPARADELVSAAGADCVHPLFMPTSVRALAA